jgi:NifU-like protein
MRSHANPSPSWQNRLVAFYPGEIDERFRSPANAASDELEVTGASASFVCGSVVRLSVNIDVDSGRIEKARFRTNGCGFMIAAADALCDRLANRPLAELHGLDDNELILDLADDLGTFPPERVQCAVVVFESLRSAMSVHRAHRIEEFVGEKALICTCFGVSEESIIAAISENGFTDVEQVAVKCRAGSGCGSCRFLIQELIDMQSAGFD